MKLKISFLSLMLIFINLTLSVSYECEYYEDIYYDYTCKVFPSSSEIGGQHEHGKNDNDVNRIRYIGTLNEVSQLNQSNFPFCQRFTNLAKIHIDKKIDFISENLLLHCKNLKKLTIESSKIKEIDENLFLENSKLTILNLNDNELSFLPENVFITQTVLEILNLSANKISILSTNIFKSLEKLKILNLARNKISNLDQNVFKFLRNLEKLDLWQNQLITIHSDSFGIHLNLKYINLQWNKISSFDKIVVENTALSVINMIGNNCSNAEIKRREFIENNLRKCFENYRKRDESASMRLHSVTENLTTGVNSSSEKPSKSTCGIRVMGLGTVIGGTQVKKGSFPWTGALLRDNGDFFCGATLISDEKVVTAAHCIEEKFSNIILRPRDIIVVLGAHNLLSPVEIGKQSIAVKKITVHPDWHPRVQSYDADIAILELAKRVHFDEFIQPICLTIPESPIKLITFGVVVGYGKSEFNDVENIARVVNIPILSYRTCAERSSDHQSLLSHRAFCGGFANGTGVCVGDSGSGLIVEYNGVYYLRGIVSSSLYGNIHGCNVYTFSVFTDVIKFHDWIFNAEAQKQDIEKQKLEEENRKLRELIAKLEKLSTTTEG